MQQFKGVGVALITPFMENGKIDFPALEKVVEHIINGGVDYIVVQGTTGESATLNSAEKQLVLSKVVSIVKDRVPIVFGIGGNNTEAVKLAYDGFDLTGVAAILSVSPYYNKPTQEGIYRHFKVLANHFDHPIILYNVPGRTQSNMLPATTLRLANDCENIIAIKEASGDLDQMSTLIKNKPSGFIVLSGDDNLVLPQMAIGADGVISVIANAFPVEFSNMVLAAARDDMSTARKRHFQLSDIIPLLFVEGNPAGVKAVLEMMGLCLENVRLPLVPVSETTRNNLYNVVSQAGIKLD